MLKACIHPLAIIIVLIMSGCQLPNAADEDAKTNCSPEDITVTFKDGQGNPYPNLDLQMREGSSQINYTPTSVKTDSNGELQLGQMGCNEYGFRLGTTNGQEVTAYPYPFLSDLVYGEVFSSIKRKKGKTKYEVVLPKIIYSNASSPNSPAQGARQSTCLWQDGAGLDPNSSSASWGCFRPESRYVAQPIIVSSWTRACGLGLGIHGINQYFVDQVEIRSDQSGVPGTVLFSQTTARASGAYTSYGVVGSYVDFCKEDRHGFEFLPGHKYWITARYNSTPAGIALTLKPGLASAGLAPLESADGSTWQSAFVGWLFHGYQIPSLSFSTAILNSFLAGTLVPADFTIEVFLTEAQIFPTPTPTQSQ